EEVREPLRLLEEPLGARGIGPECLVVGVARPETDFLVQLPAQLFGVGGAAVEPAHIYLDFREVRREREELAPRARAAFLAAHLRREPVSRGDVRLLAGLRLDPQVVVV